MRRQCELLTINRRSLYVKRRGESAQNLELMRLIDGHFLQHSTKGVLQMQDFLAQKGYVVNHKRLRRLIRKMGIEPVYPKANLSKLRPNTSGPNR